METSQAIHPGNSGQQVLNQSQTLGPITRVAQVGHVVQLHTKSAVLQLLFVDEGTIRLHVHKGIVVDLSSTIAVVQNTKIGIPLSIVDAETEVRVAAGEKLQVLIDKQSLSLRIENGSGDSVYNMSGLSVDAGGKITGTFVNSSDDHFYGLGEKTSFLDKRGERYRMWNSDVYAPHNPEIEALYVSVPFLIHSRAEGKFGLFLDNPGESVFDMRSRRDAFTISSATGDFDLYLFAGPTTKEVVRRYTELTGKIALPPAWALGYHQSRYSYMDEGEVRELAKNFRDRGIPCDAIHFDIHYMNGYRVFTFDETRFPDPKNLIQSLANDGFHVIPIVDPGVKRDPKFLPYESGIAEDVFCKYIEGHLFTGDVWPGESAFPDFTEPRVREWWGSLHQFYTDLGIRGIWNDMNEPAVFNETKTMDVSVMHRNDGNPKTHGELHNLYGMMMSTATVDGMRKLLDNERPFLLTRAGYAGIGRLGAVWTGDNRSFWEHMAMAVPMVLNMGLSGIPFTGPDVGGFAHDTNGELLARWTQMGAFFPFFRNHSALDTIRQEPWVFTSEVEDICRTYIRMRYAYMPYLYTLMQEASATGIPVLRPLFLEFESDPNVTNLSDQFMVGSQLLVAPVLQPDQRKRMVYLPEGHWFELATGQVHTGPAHLIADAPLDTLPMYVKEGAILPRHTVGSHVDFGTVRTLSFDVFGRPSEQTSYTLYEDDGLSYNFERGAYNKYTTTLQSVADGLVVEGRYDVNGFDTSYTVREWVFKGCLGDGQTVSVASLEEVNWETIDSVRQGYCVNGAGDVIVRIPAEQKTVSFKVQLHEGN